MTDNPLGHWGSVRRPRATRGGRTDAVNGGTIRHTTRGAETSGGGWRVADGGEVQVDGIPRQESKRGAGDTKRE